jgi:hypothetical protein
VMDEYVLTPVAWTDKPETLCTVEPLYNTLHNNTFSNLHIGFTSSW